MGRVGLVEARRMATTPGPQPGFSATPLAAAAPLLADAHAGLAQCQRRTDSAAPSFLAMALQRHVGQRLQRTGSLQIVCGILFLGAIACHSRLSLVVALIVLLGCSILTLVSAKLGQFLTDPAFVANLLPLSLALGGKCLRLSAINTLWCIVAAVLLGLLWAMLAPSWVTLGLPLLCLPFHILLGGSLAIYAIVDRRSLIPLENAVGSVEEVRVWLVKGRSSIPAWSSFGEVEWSRTRWRIHKGAQGRGRRGCVGYPHPGAGRWPAEVRFVNMTSINSVAAISPRVRTAHRRANAAPLAWMLTT